MSTTPRKLPTATLKLPIRFASGTFMDGDGKTITPKAIIERLELHDDLVRSLDLLFRCCQDTACGSMIIQDANNTLVAAENIS